MKKESMNQVKMEMEYKEMRECTFKPKINSRAKRSKEIEFGSKNTKRERV